MFKRQGRIDSKLIYGLLVLGMTCLSAAALAGKVQLKFSAKYTLPSGISKAIPILRFCNHPMQFSRLFMDAALTSSSALSQGVFFPSTTDFVSPGLALRDSSGNTHYTYCADQVPYRLGFTTLNVVFDSIARTAPYAVRCHLQIAGG